MICIGMLDVLPALALLRVGGAALNPSQPFHG
jgi:hypothetical protein